MSSTQPSAQIVIVGGGICGLTAALSVARAGRSVQVLERAPMFSEEGAGIQLGPNAVRLLRRLGVHNVLARSASEPHSIDMYDGITGKSLASLPIRTWSKSKHKAEYWVVHRAALQNALLEVCRTVPDIQLTPGYEVSRLEDAPSGGVLVHSENGYTLEAEAVIGADGVGSKVRAQFFPTASPQYSGKAVRRALVPIKSAPDAIRKFSVGLWMGPEGHIVHYPVDKGRNFNIVVTASDPQLVEGWSTMSDPAPMQEKFLHWCEPVRTLLETAKEWRRWSLFDMPPLAQWVSGRVVIAGDAAHPVFPFLAQGGALAVEDGLALGRVVDQFGDDYASAWQKFQSLRRARAIRVYRASQTNGQIYHLRGLGAIARNLALRLTPPTLLLARYNWLYGHKLS